MVRPRVLMAAEVIGPGGGPAGYTFNLLAGFAERGAIDPFDVVGETRAESARYRGTGEQRAESAPVRTVRRAIAELPHPILFRLLSRARWLTSGRDRAHRRAYAAADIVVFQGYQPSVRMAWAKRRGKTTLYMPHSPSPTADEERMIELARVGRSSTARYRFLRWDEARSIALSDVVVFASPGAAEQYDEAFPGVLRRAERHYVSSGVAEPVAGRPPGAANGRTVLFAGRFVRHKGYDLFLDTAAAAKAVGVEAAFTTLGTGPEAREHDDVTDLGWSEDPASELRDAAVVVVPNRIAYFDLLPIEAAALGKPLVMTRVGGNVDQLEMLPDSIGAEVDPDSLAVAVRSALERLDLDPTYGRRNRDVYLAQFTPAQLAARWAALLADLQRRAR